MSKPILYPISAFDRSTAQEFRFSYQGNQAFKNKLTVYNSETNEIVYSREQATMQLLHTLPENTLMNGICYTADITVFDRDNLSSPASDKIIFYCFTSPVFQFTNLGQNQIVRNASIDLLLQYEQIEEEPLASYQIVLYDHTQRQLQSSGMRYDSADRHFQITSLEENQNYYARATGSTRNGMLVDTGMVPFSVEYVQPNVWSKLIAENLFGQGEVKLSTHIVSVIGESSPDPPRYIDNEMVDLTGEGAHIRFEGGYQITSDFTMQIEGRSFTPNEEVMVFSNERNRIVIRYCIDRFNGQERPKAFVELSAYNTLTRYYLISNLIDVPGPEIMLSIWVRRIGALYDVKLAPSKGDETV